MAALLAPHQLGYGVSGGAKAAVHAARKFLSNLDPEHAIVTLDFSNAFNSIRRDSMLEAIRSHAPSIYPLVHTAYSVQCFVGVTEPFPQQKESNREILWALSFFVSHDISLGGSCEDILYDLDVI